MKKFVLLLFIMLAVVCRAQQGSLTDSSLVCGPFYGEFEEETINASAPDGLSLSFPQATVGTRVGAEEGTRWIDRITNMPDYMRDFYEYYGECVNEVYKGKSNWVSDPALGKFDVVSNTYYTLIKTFTGDVDFTAVVDATNALVTESAKAAVERVCKATWNEVYPFVFYLTRAMNRDYPEAFWISNNDQWGLKYNWKYKYDYQSRKGVASYNLEVYLRLKSDIYDRRLDNMRDPILVQTAVSDFSKKVNEILSACPDGSRYEKIVYLNDWLTKHNCYNPDYDGNHQELMHELVWSPYSAIMETIGKDGPVCEAYARAFKVLCDKSGIPCVVVRGNAKGGLSQKVVSHMWNEAMMEDGKWYAVDVTWNDPIVDVGYVKESGAENHKWLLLGKKDIVSSGLTFEKSHVISIESNISEEIMSRWEFTIASLIEDYKYVTTAISSVQRDSDDKLRVYDFNGRYLGIFNSVNDLNIYGNRPVIVNGKKRVHIPQFIP